MRYRRASDVTHEDAGDRAVLLDGSGSAMTTLNPVGSMIWRELDGDRSTSELAMALASHFDGVDQPTLEADIDAFLAELSEDGLVEAIDY